MKKTISNINSKVETYQSKEKWKKELIKQLVVQDYEWVKDEKSLFINLRK